MQQRVDYFLNIPTDILKLIFKLICEEDLYFFARTGQSIFLIAVHNIFWEHRVTNQLSDAIKKISNESPPVKDHNGCTPLHHVGKFSQSSLDDEKICRMMERLINAGADPLVKFNGENILYMLRSLMRSGWKRRHHGVLRLDD